MKGLQLNVPQTVLLLVAFTLVAVAMFAAGTKCSPSPAPVVVPGGIDAGPGEAILDARLDASIAEQRQQIEEITRQYEEDIAAFDESQRRKFEQLQERSLDDVVDFLARWHEQRNRR